jgi:hypothetical protein
MRRDIDRRPHRIKQTLQLPGMRKDYLGGVADDEKKAVKKFLESNQSNALKTRPKVSDCSPFCLYRVASDALVLGMTFAMNLQCRRNFGSISKVEHLTSSCRL